jgi:DNA repair protein RecO (recombination protein O)
MICKTRGVALGHIKFSENSVIAKFFTEEFGLKSYIINNIGKKGAKIKPNILQPLTLVDLVVYHNEKNSIQRIKEIKLSYLFVSIPFDIKKSSIALFINEILCKSIDKEESNRNLFNYVYNSVKLLDILTEKFAVFHLIFMLELSRYLGFYPLDNYSDKFIVINLQEGFFQKNIPQHSNYISEPISHLFHELLNSSINNINDNALIRNREYRKELLDKLIDYYRLHISGFKEINSHRIFETIFS